MLCSFLTLAAYLYNAGSGLGMSSVIAFYALSAVKYGVLCFLSASTLFLSILALIFTVRTILKNAGAVRKYGVIMTVISAETALAGAAAFIAVSVYMANFNG